MDLTLNRNFGLGQPTTLEHTSLAYNTEMSQPYSLDHTAMGYNHLNPAQYPGYSNCSTSGPMPGPPPPTCMYMYPWMSQNPNMGPLPPPQQQQQQHPPTQHPGPPQHHHQQHQPPPPPLPQQQQPPPQQQQQQQPQPNMQQMVFNPGLPPPDKQDHRNFGQNHHLKVRMKMHMDEKPYPLPITSEPLPVKTVPLPSGPPKARNANLSGEKPHKCHICSKAFSASNHLKRHMTTHTQEKPHTCYICAKGFTRPDNLKAHMVVHTSDKPFECEVCKKRFKTAVQAKTHMIIHTGTKNHKCEQCGRAFLRMDNLKEHIRIHSGVKPHKCIICGRAFVRSGNLKDHMKVHLNKPKAPRGKAKTTKGTKTTKATSKAKTKISAKKLQDLKELIKIHSGNSTLFNEKEPAENGATPAVNASAILDEMNKPHKCEICHKGFTATSHLKRHMIIHTGERPNTCEVCGKTFTRPDNLKDHMSIHTGEKPHKCFICGRCYSSQGKMNAHFKTHIGEKTHKCTVCERAFVRSENLKEHMRIHTGEKPYQCTECGRKFTRSSNLKNHLKVHEPGRSRKVYAERKPKATKTTKSVKKGRGRKKRRKARNPRKVIQKKPKVEPVEGGEGKSKDESEAGGTEMAAIEIGDNPVVTAAETTAITSETAVTEENTESSLATTMATTASSTTDTEAVHVTCVEEAMDIPENVTVKSEMEMPVASPPKEVAMETTSAISPVQTDSQMLPPSVPPIENHVLPEAQRQLVQEDTGLTPVASPVPLALNPNSSLHLPPVSMVKLSEDSVQSPLPHMHPSVQPPAYSSIDSTVESSATSPIIAPLHSTAESSMHSLVYTSLHSSMHLTHLHPSDHLVASSPQINPSHSSISSHPAPLHHTLQSTGHMLLPTSVETSQHNTYKDPMKILPDLDVGRYSYGMVPYSQPTSFRPGPFSPPDLRSNDYTQAPLTWKDPMATYHPGTFSSPGVGASNPWKEVMPGLRPGEFPQTSLMAPVVAFPQTPLREYSSQLSPGKEPDNKGHIDTNPGTPATSESRDF